VATWVAGSIETSPIAMAVGVLVAAGAGVARSPVRRSTARMRAISSAMLNGFTR
jgi:hypothetical protein